MAAFNRRSTIFFVAAAMAVVLLFQLEISRPWSMAADQDPWTRDQVMTPGSLAKVLSRSPSTHLAVVCVGFDSLFDGAHIPGAVYLGPAQEPKGIEALTKWARGVRREKEVVLYCGCCPWSQCPNIRPAFRTLAALGFKRLRVVEIDQDFAHDWVAKGYPVQKSK